MSSPPCGEFRTQTSYQEKPRNHRQHKGGCPQFLDSLDKPRGLPGRRRFVRALEKSKDQCDAHSRQPGFPTATEPRLEQPAEKQLFKDRRRDHGRQDHQRRFAHGRLGIEQPGQWMLLHLDAYQRVVEQLDRHMDAEHRRRQDQPAEKAHHQVLWPTVGGPSQMKRVKTTGQPDEHKDGADLEREGNQRRPKPIPRPAQALDGFLLGRRGLLFASVVAVAGV
jgi:hypothetical protein